MILHGEVLLSLDLFEKEFVCNLTRCKGMCCVEGDSGAPLEAGEVDIIAQDIEAIKPYMNDAGRELLEREGFHEKDEDGDLVTTCVSGRDCVFAINEAGVYKCAIEKAWQEGKTSFRKPVSCHLYPLRVSSSGAYKYVNYNRWDICSAACELGSELKVPVYKFLKDALTRNFGMEWYAELEVIAEELKSESR